MKVLTASIIAGEVEEAEERLNALRKRCDNAVLVTPMLRSRTWLEAVHNPAGPSLRKVYLKLESEQITGSFKVRGALNFVSAALERGQETVVTASTGNHGLGTAHALELLGGKGVIFVPADASRVKVDAMRAYTTGGKLKVRSVNGDCLAAEMAARKYAEDAAQGGAHYLSPYNDREVVAGQGTIGVDIERALRRTADGGAVDDVHCLYVTVGGGGLIAGIAAYLKKRSKFKWRVVGAQPRKSPVMAMCAKAGRVIEVECDETLSDGSAGPIEEGAMTLGPCIEVVDEWILVDEDEIAMAVRECFLQHRKVVEGTAGVAIAAYMKDTKWQKASTRSVNVILVCGGNIDPDIFVDVVSGNRRPNVRPSELIALDETVRKLLEG